MKYELHVYSIDRLEAGLGPQVFYFVDLDKAKALARKYFRNEEGVYKCKVWNKDRAVPNRKTADLLYELI